MARAHPLTPGWDKAQLLAALLLLGVWLSLASDLGRASQRNDPWIVGDWLINYAGGFVRRGLPGEA